MALSQAQLPPRCFTGPVAACSWELQDTFRSEGTGDAVFGSPGLFAPRMHALVKAGAPAWVLCTFLNVAKQRGTAFTAEADADNVVLLLQALVKASRIWQDANVTQVRPGALPACGRAAVSCLCPLTVRHEPGALTLSRRRRL